MSSAAATTSAANADPVFGFILLGGSLSGALVRDIRLANELASRGFVVHVFWAMDCSRKAGLLPSIKQHWLFHGLRFWGRPGRGLLESAGRFMSGIFSDRARQHWIQTRPQQLQHVMETVTRCLCDGVGTRDASLVRRFAAELQREGITHVLPMLEMLCPWIDAARAHIPASKPKYLVTFQGYELYSTYARNIDLERLLYDRLVETVAHSDWPAIAVSEDYLRRVVEEVGVPANQLVAIPPGVPAATAMDADRARELVQKRFPEYAPGVPLISYLGRRDTEKGLDLLLYAGAILRRRGLSFQLAICGPTLWGTSYAKVCQKIAEELRCPVLWRGHIPEETRTALFTHSHCVVYPSIHREPFGMVAAEVIAHGTPAIVPDFGGVASAIEADGETAGLRFRIWDSGNLADQISRLLQDGELHARLSAAGPRVAEYFSIKNLGDRVLAHMGLPLKPGG